MSKNVYGRISKLDRVFLKRILKGFREELTQTEKEILINHIDKLIKDEELKITTKEENCSWIPTIID